MSFSLRCKDRSTGSITLINTFESMIMLTPSYHCSIPPRIMKIKYFINLHKGTTFFFVLGLMFIYQNFSLGPWVYLALHGTYGFLWLIKDRLYPDKQWEQEVPWSIGIIGFFIVCLYWIAPFLLISNPVEPPLVLVAIAISLNIFGVFLHYTSDAQKYYTLKYHKGLITEGFFARCRNTNYLGEVMIYAAFALLAMHWLPFVILAGFVATLFIPNMLKKDQSLSRYPEFEAYRSRSGLIWPNFFSTSPAPTTAKE
jgi:protein-S-isoprenylcysteine O-methyltransferase Ste14